MSTSKSSGKSDNNSKSKNVCDNKNVDKYEKEISNNDPDKSNTLSIVLRMRGDFCRSG